MSTLALSSHSQPSILAPLAAHGRSLSFRLKPEADPRAALSRLAREWQPAWGVVGLGAPLVAALGRSLPGLHPFPALAGPGVSVPSTQQALWVLLLGEAPSPLFDRAQALHGWLAEAFDLVDGQDTFQYAGGRDLTGYEDGTENPQDEAAVAAALVPEGALAGSSYVAVQRWSHDLAHFRSHSPAERDDLIGRRQADNEELEDAPESAHVKRSAQESYSPEAFMVRRSMPWATAREQGLEFIAYGHSLAAFEQVLTRMVGLEDGVVDGLFRFSRPVTGGYYWCPPLAGARLDLSAVL